MSLPVVLITGCSSGIGRALAEAFVQAGYRVFAGARKAADLEQLNSAGCCAVKLDVNDPEDLARVVQRLETEAGRLDVLINNAGYGAMGPLLDGGAQALRAQFETNVFSLIELSRLCFPLLRQSQGVIVNIGSVSSVLITPFAGAYCASKAAVHALSEALRLELKPFGVDVLEVQPGAIASHFGEQAAQQAQQWISRQSPWWPYRQGILARAKASQDKPTPAHLLAQKVLILCQNKARPRVLRIGSGSRLLPVLVALLPKAVLERQLIKRFALNRPQP